MNHYVTPAIAKETLGVSLQTLRRWAKAGKIKHFRTPGGQFRYDLASVGIAPVAVRTVEIAPAPVVPRIVSRPVEPPPAAKPMPQAPIQPRLDPAALRRAVEGLAMASRV
jgi:excisionase family DNA binding protein